MVIIMYSFHCDPQKDVPVYYTKKWMYVYGKDITMDNFVLIANGRKVIRKKWKLGSSEVTIATSQSLFSNNKAMYCEV